MSTLQKLKNVDKITHEIVFGYVHQIESLLQNHNIVIPSGIINLCLLYYWIMEEFDDSLHGEHITISNQNRNIIKCKLQWKTAFGTFIIDSNKYPNSNITWTLKMKSDHNGAFSIGIVEIHKTNNDSNTLNGNVFLPDVLTHDTNILPFSIMLTNDEYEYKFYGLYVDFHYSILDTHDDLSVTDACEELNNEALVLCPEQDNTLIMELNCKDKTIEYHMNDTKLGIAFTNVDFSCQYKFAVSMYSETKKLEIIDFVISDC
eukprot:548655_1